MPIKIYIYSKGEVGLFQLFSVVCLSYLTEQVSFWWFKSHVKLRAHRKYAVLKQTMMTGMHFDNCELHNTLCLHLLYSLRQMKVCWFRFERQNLWWRGLSFIQTIYITSALCGWSRIERKKWKSKTGIQMERCLRIQCKMIYIRTFIQSKITFI